MTLRLVLATFGFVVCTAGAVAFAVVGAGTVLVVVTAVLALVAALDRRRAPQYDQRGARA